ncbi:hypothetical protein [Novosphingobium sp.]|uniref:hypothetical protein n=1 Tax=Novosphingobium sp. TaxID=1874826 RepID=UPI003D13AED9
MPTPIAFVQSARTRFALVLVLVLALVLPMQPWPAPGQNAAKAPSQPASARPLWAQFVPAQSARVQEAGLRPGSAGQGMA